ncbi:hypothetical protein PYCC9005_002358 [Savitreella phatthalungensis]
MRTFTDVEGFLREARKVVMTFPSATMTIGQRAGRDGQRFKVVAQVKVPRGSTPPAAGINLVYRTGKIVELGRLVRGSAEITMALSGAGAGVGV